jgi:hypothetical protein
VGFFLCRGGQHQQNQGQPPPPNIPTHSWYPPSVLGSSTSGPSRVPPPIFSSSSSGTNSPRMPTSTGFQSQTSLQDSSTVVASLKDKRWFPILCIAELCGLKALHVFVQYMLYACGNLWSRFLGPRTGQHYLLLIAYILYSGFLAISLSRLSNLLGTGHCQLYTCTSFQSSNLMM